MDQDRIPTHFRVNGALIKWIVLLDNSYPLSLRNGSIRKNIL